jgi:hypothetical protein
MKKNYTISYNLKEAYNHVLVHLTMQDLLVIKYQNLLYKTFRSEQCSKSVHSNNKENYSRHGE